MEIVNIINEIENSDGFKFAISALAALVAFLIYSVNYLQNTPISLNLYRFSLFIFYTVIVSIIFLVSYIFIKSLTMEMGDKYYKKSLEELASEIYILSFFITISNFIFMIYFFIVLAVNLDGFINVISYIVMLIFFFISIHLYVRFSSTNQKLNYKLTDKKIETFQPKKSKEKARKWPVSFFIRIMSSLKWLKTKHPKVYSCVLKLSLHDLKRTYQFSAIVSILLVFSIIPVIISIFITPGYVTINLGSIHYKDDTQIPVFIEVTGLNTDLNVTLFKEDSEHIFIQVDNIVLKPKHNTYQTSSGENSILVGNTLNYGIYNVFINTTNLTEG